MDLSLISVAKICSGAREAVWSKNSNHAMATEYASSPVAQPGTHTLMDESGPRCFKTSGNTLSVSASNVYGSLKKLVTAIRMSWYKESTSAGFCCRYLTYS